MHDDTSWVRRRRTVRSGLQCEQRHQLLRLGERAVVADQLERLLVHGGRVDEREVAAGRPVQLLRQLLRVMKCKKLPNVLKNKLI